MSKTPDSAVKTESRSLSVEEKLELFEAFFESAEIGICVTDQNRRFVLVNSAYCQTYGYPEDELIGEPFTKVLPEDVRAAAEQLHDEFLAGGTESDGDWDVIDKRGRRRQVFMTAARVQLTTGERYKVTTVSDVSESRRVENELKQLSEVVARTSHGVLFTDVEGKTTWANQSCLRMTGFSLSELLGRKPGDLFQGPNSDPAVVAQMAKKLADGQGFQVEIVNYTKDTTPYDVHIACSPVRDDRGNLEGFMALQTDISDRKQSQQAIEQVNLEAQKLSIAIAQSPTSIVMTDTDGRIEFINQTGLKNSGYSLNELIGKNPRLFQSGRTDQSIYQDLWATISSGKNWQGRLVNKRKDGSEYIEWASISPVQDEHGQTLGFIAVKEDVTERERLADRLQSIEKYDALTGLANRAFFVSLLDERLLALRKEKGRQPLAVIDFDRFHALNILHGHEVGDLLLQTVAQRLSDQAPEDALIARLGPDEFGVLPPLRAINASTVSQSDDFQWVSRLQCALREEFCIGRTPIKASASIGVAFSESPDQPSSEQRAGDFLRAADSALRSAKALGGGRIAFFDNQDTTRAQESLRLEQDLSEAIARGELHIALQSQVNPAGHLVGAEALLRWSHTQLGMISPARFIPIAEETGHIVEIGRWVLAQALTALSSMQAFDSKLSISVNISPVQIRRPGFVDEVEAMLEGAEVDSTRLILEITESVFLDEPELATAKLQALRNLGVGISIDDFGTGYSSLSYLKRLPVSELKIDHSFVDGLPDDPADTALVNIILSAASQLSLQVVAEGVETQEQADYFQDYTQVYLQGYRFDRPTQVAEWASRWLNRH